MIEQIFWVALALFGLVLMGYKILLKKQNTALNGFLACYFLVMLIKTSAPVLSKAFI